MPTSTTARPVDRMLLRAGRVTLVFLYLVILAGALVRATGSGMGCPDWPKCFGYYIPPTDPAQLDYHAGEAYTKGRMVIVNDTLWRAPQAFTGAPVFSRAQWEKYPAHNYAKFVVRQTWIEYINRLFGALSGLAMFVTLVIALSRLRRDKITVLWLLAGVVLLGFVAWLGKVVVDTNLAPYKITIHMLSALALVAIVLVVNNRVRTRCGMLEKTAGGALVWGGLFIVLALTLTQVILGTQVRQEVDTLYKLTENTGRETWVSQLSGIYSIHLITALLVVALNAILFWMLRRLQPLRRLATVLLALLLLEYAVGVLLHRAGIPAAAQPVHLLLATVVFGLQFALLLRVKR